MTTDGITGGRQDRGDPEPSARRRLLAIFSLRQLALFSGFRLVTTMVVKIRVRQDWPQREHRA
jgi:hypothetical protein